MPKSSTRAPSPYPVDEWAIVENTFQPEHTRRSETIFALGNGYFGTRGTFEEGLHGATSPGLEGTYINGFYESETIRYPEVAYGFPDKSQTMLNVINGKVIRLFVSDEEFNLLTGTILEYRRTLNLRAGRLDRNVTWRSPAGREVNINTTRLVSFDQPHLMAISMTVTPFNFSDKIRLIAALDGDVTNVTTANDPRSGSNLQGRVVLIQDRFAEGTGGALVSRNKHNGFGLACAMETRFYGPRQTEVSCATDEFSASVTYSFGSGEDQWGPGKEISVQIEKFVSYVTSLDTPDADILARAREIVTAAKASRFPAIETAQRHYVAAFWERADVQIKGDPALQQGIRFNMFHLLQSVGKDGRTNISAKGLTGEGYEGHYFWDTETYVLPFFLFNSPDISRKLLEYRYGILDRARARAREMSHPRGALFPWRTINGDECSTYYPAGTAQYHIDADIALAIKRYVEATGDRQFLIDYGAEMLFETARLWASLGSFIPHKGNQFCINAVTGPDEYTAVVNNNCYTNLMAQTNLRYAVEVAGWLRTEQPQAYEKLIAAIDLNVDELAFWTRAADAMYLPRDEERGIYLQDDAFLDRAPWDFANTPPENYPLLTHYHPLVIYRHQVCKQADLVLALLLLSQRFTRDEKRRNYDFYEPLTTHDSSLSMCIFSIIACEIGYHDKAYAYFSETARMDLDDTHHNVKDGIHVANMAGAWLSVVNGFAGMRAYDDVLRFDPSLPASWESYSFKVTYRDALLSVTIDRTGTTYELLGGSAITFSHGDRALTLDAAQKSVVVN